MSLRATLISLIITLLFLPVLLLQLVAANAYMEFKTAGSPGFFLLLGTDSGGKDSIGGRTDFILALRSGTTGIEALRIPRDSLVLWNGEQIKINSLLNRFGIDAVKKSIENILKSHCFGYMIVDYETVVHLTDYVGPVVVEVLKPMHYDDFQQDLHIHFEPGIYELAGNELLGYLRYRYDATGDLGRIERQKEVMVKLLENLKKSSFSDMLKTAVFFIRNSEIKFELANTLEFAKRVLHSGFAVTFSTLPYRLDEKGNVIILTEQREDIPHEPKVLVINNIPGFRSFSEIVKGQWLVRTGLHIDTIDEWIPNPYIAINETLIFINNPKDEILELFGAAHPLHKPSVFRTYELEGLKKYFSVLEAYSMNKHYFTDYDYVVLLGSKR
ncbi:LCP family protein [Kosmotoga pacifica]|uniref:Cell envelope-related transcriptional attenuator domain-containing protein n=1 Tax=Kosmotoga pacifica TaxID=1330330 RepID=A0A0G2Z5T3_9BACT|nr:LCP family protein [Kosmotoga pacifica]AKI96945.1 hypothetical protein IX53_02920 [Kosmotoga pacifica]